MTPGVRDDLAEVLARFRAGSDPLAEATQPTLEALERASRVMDTLRTSRRARRALPLQVAVALALDQGWDLLPPPRARRDLARCETCGAARGARCVNASGEPTNRPHRHRGVPA